MVVDDQAVLRAGLVAVLDAEPDMTVVGEAADGASAVARARLLRPDVVAMDIRMPGMDGLTATRLLTAADDAPKVLVLTTFDVDGYVFEALRAGASGFLLKDAGLDEVVTAVRTVARGEAMLAPTVTRRLIDAFASGAVQPSPTTGGALDSLTPREVEVLSLVARGLSNAEIAAALTITVGTVKVHVNALLSKLGVRDRVHATILAYDVGLVRPQVRPPHP